MQITNVCSNTTTNVCTNFTVSGYDSNSNSNTLPVTNDPLNLFGLNFTLDTDE